MDWIWFYLILRLLCPKLWLPFVQLVVGWTDTCCWLLKKINSWYITDLSGVQRSRWYISTSIFNQIKMQIHSFYKGLNTERQLSTTYFGWYFTISPSFPFWSSTNFSSHKPQCKKCTEIQIINLWTTTSTKAELQFCVYTDVYVYHTHLSYWSYITLQCHSWDIFENQFCMWIWQWIQPRNQLKKCFAQHC